MDPLYILRNKFGYENFRLNQEAIIASILAGRDTFVLMPTGGGKSLCYQIPALALDGLALVVSPLIALMKDQVDALRLNGVPAAYLNSTQTYQQQEVALRQAREKSLKLLYLAPEKLLANSMSLLRTLQPIGISLIAIDEAHCISHWGHDFRPEYRMLSTVKKSFPGVPMIALTATADQLTRNDIVEKLGLEDPAVFVSSFNRKNIRYLVQPKRKDAFQMLLDFLAPRRDQSGIIYCLSRRSTEQLASDLQECGFQALPYHAGMDRNQRAKHQEMFLRDDVRIIVATIAFGMGIDKSNVRYVVHMDLPKNIESYYQETGRAGRDGLPSDVLLFYSYGDVARLKRFAQIENNAEQTDILMKKLDQMGEYGELTTCRRKYLLNYFDEPADDHCGNCDVCLHTGELVDVTDVARKAIDAVKQLGTRYVVDFLRGSQSARISSRHKGLELYRAGHNMTREAWSEIIRALIQLGYLTRTYHEGYPLLKVAHKGEAVLAGTEKVMLARGTDGLAGWAALQEKNLPYEADLYERLKVVRKRFADEEDVPPDVVLSDVALSEMAMYLPGSRLDLARLSGFGASKLDRYGDVFLKEITDHCRAHGLSSNMHLKGTARAIEPPKESQTMQMTFTLFRQGNSVEQIAALRKLAVSTIEKHLSYYVETGQIDVAQVVDPARVPHIRKAIEQVGGTKLTPVKDVLGDAYSYSEIRYVMASMASSRVAEPEMA